MAPIKSIRVNAGQGYDVLVGCGLLDCVGEIILSVIKPCKTAVITDSTVKELYLKRVEKSLSGAGFDVCSYAFSAGEPSKNMNTLSGILEFLAENKLTRTDAVIALGGGVVGDVTGFAAGVFLRGVKFIQIPTTLLAAVDSSVGGKTAVDLKAGKNLAGVFLQPSAVICDTDTLSTLPKVTLSDGIAEAIKTGILFDEELFSVFETGEVSEKLPFIIERCVMHKGRIVENDEFDKGERQLLNLGHTIGHAIEKCSEYKVSHGHAVAAGMAIITRAAEKLGLCEVGCAKRIEHVLIKNCLPVSTIYSAKELSDAALSDKKRAGDEISLVIPKRIGECVLKKVHVDKLEGVAASGMED